MKSSSIWIGLGERSTKATFLCCALGLVGCGREQIIQHQESSSDVRTELVMEEERIVAESTQSNCPNDMVEVKGLFCPAVLAVCKTWVTLEGEATKAAIPRDGVSGRCGEFVKPTKCLSDKKIPMRFCMDRYEGGVAKGETPQAWVSWNEGKQICETQGKRLCHSSEWTLACSGPEMKPLPYGDGYHRSKACNIDVRLPDGFSVLTFKRNDKEMLQQLNDRIAPAGSFSDCVSDYGLHDLSGNLDELVINDSGYPYKSGLMGGAWVGVRNACYAMTTAHGEDYSFYQEGYRCCKNTNDINDLRDEK